MNSLAAGFSRFIRKLLFWPIDPELSVLSVIAAEDDLPICVMANFSMHYFGDKAISADYFAMFAARIAELLQADGEDASFVGILSNGDEAAGSEEETIENFDSVDTYRDGVLVASVAQEGLIRFRGPVAE